MSTLIRRILAILQNLFLKVYIGVHELKSCHVHPYQTYFSHFIILRVHVNTKNMLKAQNVIDKLNQIVYYNSYYIIRKIHSCPPFYYVLA